MSPGRSRSVGTASCDVEPVEQVAAKLPVRDGLLQIHVGRGNHAHVDRHAGARTEPHDLALLQHAQQLDLHRQRQVADLVEKQRAAVRGLEPAGLRAERAGTRLS